MDNDHSSGATMFAQDAAAKADCKAEGPVEPDGLAVHMTPGERACFCGFLQSARSYVEFGCGGSTVLASTLVTHRIISIDSATDWIQRVDAACGKNPDRAQVKLIHVDIGPTGEWGRPLDESAKDRWPRYCSDVWTADGAADADLYLVDGRFRVACALETLMRCRSDAVLLIHDYAPRAEYHVIEQFARLILSCENLSAFVRRSDFSSNRAGEMLARYRTDPS